MRLALVTLVLALGLSACGTEGDGSRAVRGEEASTAATTESSASAEGTLAVSPQPPEPAISLECQSRQRLVGIFDVIPPRSTAEARAQGWPRTAHDAALATIEAPAFSASLAKLRLGEGVPLQRRGGGPTRVQFTLTDDTGQTVATIAAEELVEGAWATTQLERCA